MQHLLLLLHHYHLILLSRSEKATGHSLQIMVSVLHGETNSIFWLPSVTSVPGSYSHIQVMLYKSWLMMTSHDHDTTMLQKDTWSRSRCIFIVQLKKQQLHLMTFSVPFCYMCLKSCKVTKCWASTSKLFSTIWYLSSPSGLEVWV